MPDLRDLLVAAVDRLAADLAAAVAQAVALVAAAGLVAEPVAVLVGEATNDWQV